MATAHLDTHRAGSVESEIVDTLRRRFGPLFVDVFTFESRELDPPHRYITHYGLAIRFNADEEWRHLCRRPTLAMLLDYARVCRL